MYRAFSVASLAGHGHGIPVTPFVLIPKKTQLSAPAAPYFQPNFQNAKIITNHEGPSLFSKSLCWYGMIAVNRAFLILPQSLQSLVHVHSDDTSLHNGDVLPFPRFHPSCGRVFRRSDFSLFISLALLERPANRLARLLKCLLFPQLVRTRSPPFDFFPFLF